MEVINPVGRDFSSENDADYSTLKASCKCSNSTVARQEGTRNSSCGCADSSNGTLGTNIYKS